MLHVCARRAPLAAKDTEQVRNKVNHGPGAAPCSSKTRLYTPNNLVSMAERCPSSVRSAGSDPSCEEPGCASSLSGMEYKQPR